MRDVVAIAGVIVVALGLGGAAAYMSVDFTPPGLELIRPPKPAVAAQIKRVEERRVAQEKASGCKYCSDIAELAETFSRRADAARTHAYALKKALPQVSDETELMASRKEELKQALLAAQRAEGAASVLTGWASRCASEDFCKLRLHVTQASCATSADPRTDAALALVAAVRGAALSCASAACPSVDCSAAASLRSDIGQIESTLGSLEGGSTTSAPSSLASLPVGPSTLKAELARIKDEASYVARMLPLLLDTKKKGSQLPKMAPAMIDERAVSAATLATVMEQAAAVSDGASSDPRNEAAWRLKSLAANLAALGKDAQPGAALDWATAADALGAAVTDLAHLDALLDRVTQTKSVAQGCDTSASSAAQQLREARAMLDLCRMRSACVGRGGATTRVVSANAPKNVFERAQQTATQLKPEELGADETMQVAVTDPSAIDTLRSHGVCRRAGDLRDAKAAAPEAAEQIAEAAVPQALTPTGVQSPQDLIAGAVTAAVETPAEPEAEITTAAVVESAARYATVTPRFKPRRMKPTDPELMRAAAPIRPAAPDLTPSYQGVVLPETGAPAAASTFGNGEGGPTDTTPPGEAPVKP